MDEQLESMPTSEPTEESGLEPRDIATSTKTTSSEEDLDHTTHGDTSLPDSTHDMCQDHDTASDRCVTIGHCIRFGFVSFVGGKYNFILFRYFSVARTFLPCPLLDHQGRNMCDSVMFLT